MSLLYLCVWNKNIESQERVRCMWCCLSSEYLSNNDVYKLRCLCEPCHNLTIFVCLKATNMCCVLYLFVNMYFYNSTLFGEIILINKNKNKNKNMGGYKCMLRLVILRVRVVLLFK